MECNHHGADIELIEVVEDLRRWVRDKIKPDAVVIINSWFRCRAHNNRPANEKNSYGVFGAGSNDNSWHLTGGAADIWFPGVEIALPVARAVDLYPNKFGIGHYKSRQFMHIDVRPTAARWEQA